MTRLLQDYLADATAADAHATALTFGDEQMTYGEVATLSDRLAAWMLEAGVEAGDRVGLLLPKCPLAIVAIHAVLKAGGIYVPLDAESPIPRLGRIIQAADLKLLLAEPGGATRLQGLAESLPLGPVGSVDAEPVVAADGQVLTSFTRREWDVPAETLPDRRGRPGDAAHILFTSGSTGDPKGVVITHANVSAFVAWAVGYFGMGASDRVSGHPPLHFDLSSFDIYGAFAARAELHLLPASLSLNPRRVASFIRDRELTQWFSVPSVLTFLARFDAVGDGDFPALERLLWCGEVLPTSVLCHWMRRLPHVRFTNLYGPTEATIASSYFTLPAVPEDEARPVPIGVACAGEELVVLDHEMHAVPAGEIGDLYIGGAGLSPGYWRDEDKTAAAFLADPRPSQPEQRIYRTGDLASVDEDGLVDFHGRIDSQIKSRGYRIELGEVENALNAVEGIREGAVVGVEADAFEGTAICAAYASATPLEPVQVRTELARSLPTYMLPSRWMALEVLPKNQNGKIDRPELRKRFLAEQLDREAGRGG